MPARDGADGMGVVTLAPGSTRAKLEHLRGDLEREFPGVPLEQISLVVDALARELLATARFEDYVPLLTLRYAREHLHREAQALELAYR